MVQMHVWVGAPAPPAALWSSHLGIAGQSLQCTRRLINNRFQWAAMHWRSFLGGSAATLLALAGFSRDTPLAAFNWCDEDRSNRGLRVGHARSAAAAAGAAAAMPPPPVLIMCAAQFQVHPALCQSPGCHHGQQPGTWVQPGTAVSLTWGRCSDQRPHPHHSSSSHSGAAGRVPWLPRAGRASRRLQSGRCAAPGRRSGSRVWRHCECAAEHRACPAPFFDSNDGCT